jgi:hypothetical protein
MQPIDIGRGCLTIISGRTKAPTHRVLFRFGAETGRVDVQSTGYAFT